MCRVICIRSMFVLLCGMWVWNGGPTTSGQEVIAQTKPATQRKPQHKEKKVNQETIILPIRYVDGGRMVRLLKMFVPHKESRYTLIHYSPSLHKLLVRARPAVLKQLQEASLQLDVAQTQFDVFVYFLKAVDRDVSKPPHFQPSALLGYLKQKFPTVTHWSSVGEVHLRTLNHQEAQTKATEQGTVSEPTLRLILHQGPFAEDDIRVNLRLFHHEAFRAVSSSGAANTQFIQSTQLQSRFLVRPSQYTVIGSVPWKTSARWNERVFVVAKIDVISSQASTKSVQVKSPQPASGFLDKATIRRVVNGQSTSFRKCYERGLRLQPTLKGRLVVSFVIATSGKTTNLVMASSSLKHSQVENCILRSFASLKFPQPSGGGVVRVRYPLMFHP